MVYTRLTGDVRFFDVDFEYEEGKPILHDVIFYAKPGQKLAFVGATGAGKTTITHLINRLYDIADGRIRYDGINRAAGQIVRRPFCICFLSQSAGTSSTV